MRYMNFVQRFYWEISFFFLRCDVLGLGQCFPAFRRKVVPSKRRQIGLLTTTHRQVPKYPSPWNREYVYILSNSWSLQRISDRGVRRNLWFPFRVCIPLSTCLQFPPSPFPQWVQSKCWLEQFVPRLIRAPDFSRASIAFALTSHQLCKPATKVNK